jgi:hypothetical protein
VALKRAIFSKWRYGRRGKISAVRGTEYRWRTTTVVGSTRGESEEGINKIIRNHEFVLDCTASPPRR